MMIEARLAVAGPQDHETFRRDGLLLVRRLLPPEFVEQLRQEITAEVVAWTDGLRRDDPRYVHAGRTHVLEISDLFRIIPCLRDLELHRLLASFAGPLIGVRGLRLYQDALLQKDPRGGYVPWHQDSYYAVVDAPVVTAWIPLCPVGMADGPVEYATGSFAAGIVDHEGIDLAELVAAKQYRRESYETVPGDVLFHTGKILHRSPVNEGDAPRMAFTVFCFEDGARVCEPHYSRASRSQMIYFPGRQSGDLADTELNPVLWRAPGSDGER